MAVGTCRVRDRRSDGQVDRGADWLSHRLRGLLVSGGNMANFVCFPGARAVRAGTCAPRASTTDRGRPSLLRLGRDSHVDSEGGGPHRHRHRGHSLDPDRRSSADGCCGCSPSASRRTRRPAISRSSSWDRRLGQHRCRRSARRDRIALPRSGCLVPRRRRVRRLRGRGAGRVRRSAGARDADSRCGSHKWLYAPLEAGCALVRDAEASRRAFSYHRPTTISRRRPPTTWTSARRTRAGSAR